MLIRKREREVASISKSYSDWLGRQVILQIDAGESLVPLRGLVVTESNSALRFRLDGCWDVDIYKEMILRVEADNDESFPFSNWPAGNKAHSSARSHAIPLLRWGRAFDRWYSSLDSWQLLWKVICAAGLAGTALFVLALCITVSGPFTYFARFICGYLGLLCCAVSLGSAARPLLDSIVAGHWSKRLASFLNWCRQPIHL